MRRRAGFHGGDLARVVEQALAEQGRLEDVNAVIGQAHGVETGGL